MDLNIEFDEDTILEAFMDRIRGELSDWISQAVYESFDYHEDRFRISWMRIMEFELNDLVNSTKDNACNHGQKVYEGLFHVISEYFRVMREEAQEEDKDREQREVVQGASIPYYVETERSDDTCTSPLCRYPQCVQAREAAAQATQVVRQADPELERLLAEEEEIERREILRRNIERARLEDAQ